MKALGRGLGGAIGAAFVLAVLTGAAAAGGDRERADVAAAGPAGDDLLESYNRRDIGAPGLRRIRLQLHNDGTLTRTFEIAHAWQRSAGGDGEIRSLVLLEEPPNLRGTDYLLVEGAPSGTGLEVHLHLPTSGGRVLAVRPNRFDEGLLGSDFGYADLLWRIPVRGRSVHPLGPRRVHGVETRGYEIAPESEEAKASTTWDRSRYFLGLDPPLLIAAEYYRDSPGRPRSAEPVKRLRVEGWHQRDGVWSPSVMVMEVGAGRTSTLTLQSWRFHVEPLDPGLFRPDALAGLTATLRAGRTPAFLGELER